MLGFFQEFGLEQQFTTVDIMVSRHQTNAFILRTFFSALPKSL